jgi:hypothetical protein
MDVDSHTIFFFGNHSSYHVRFLQSNFPLRVLLNQGNRCINNGNGKNQHKLILFYGFGIYDAYAFELLFYSDGGSQLDNADH